VAIAKDGSTAVERFARSEHGALSRWLGRRFGAKLTAEDIADVVGHAYEEALAGAAHLPDAELRPWMYRVARNRAIDAIRRAKGEGAVKRSVTSLDELEVEAGSTPAVLATDDLARQEAVVSEVTRREEADRVQRALGQLGRTEREVLRLCAIDGVSIRGAVELTGLSKKQVERTRTRAMERFAALLGAPEGPACASARALLRPGHLVEPTLAKWRDAHLAGCLGCQVQGHAAYGRRLQSLAPLLPVAVPVLGRLQAACMRVAGRLPGVGELPPEAAAAGVASAGGASVGAGGLLAAGAGAKLGLGGAALVVAAAAGVSAPGLAGQNERAVARRPPVSVSRVAVRARPAATPTATPERVVRTSSRRNTKAAAVRRARSRSSAAGEFSPERMAAATATPTSTPTATPTPAARVASPPASAPTTAPPASRSAPFTQEFTP
jgi:RNA polymerase sigma factor (sigma-70 family)